MFAILYFELNVVVTRFTHILIYCCKVFGPIFSLKKPCVVICCVTFNLKIFQTEQQQQQKVDC